ncbi:hypothetical protein DV701_07445 [Ornithinimicrobium avium]|uniref:Uncharacterized protein n=1 Tax=Ornithinimicrobium avium TaxID=2283195 RepID=A0A345NLS3_9MICO|nr:hypothetical protein DV701_07445 [Ornithinimicrobium avium]
MAGTFTDVLDEVLGALAAAARGGRDATSMLEAFEKLDQLVADLSIPLLRPDRNRGFDLLDGVCLVREGVEKLVETLTAPDIAEAQRLDAEGQALIELGSRELEPSRHDKIRALAEKEELSAFEALGLDHHRGLSRGPLSGLGEGLKEVTGLPGDDVGLHVAIEGLDLASSLVDRRRYLRLCHAVEELLLACEDVLDHSATLLELQVALLQVGARQATFATAVESGEDDLTLTGLALDLVKSVRERGLRAALIPILAAVTGEPVENIWRWRTGRLLKEATARVPQLELDVMDRVLRDSSAHEDYGFEDGEVLLQGGSVRLTTDELLDRVLEVLEFFTGMTRGILVALLRSGRPLPAVERMPRRARSELIRYFAGLHGLRDVELEQTHGTVRLSAVGSLTSWPGLVGAIFPLLSNDAVTLEGRFRAPDGRDAQATADLDAYRATMLQRHEEPECCAELLKFLPLFATTQYEGDHLLGDQDWLNVATHLVSAHVDDLSLIERLRRGKEVMARASQAGADARPIGELMARVRNLGSAQGASRAKLWQVPLSGSSCPDIRSTQW